MSLLIFLRRSSKHKIKLKGFIWCDARARRGGSIINKLLNDGSLYDEYAKIAKNTNILIKDIKDNPKRYIKWTDIIKGWRGRNDDDSDN